MYIKFLLISTAVALTTTQMNAQATRTWVSGVGDDANPCSRTAPCKTFAGAISKTAAGGEINAMDPGGYGAVTITKSITLDGTGTQASILATGTNGVTINAGVNDSVVLRGLSISGAGTTAGLDTRGVKFLAGKSLVIENCSIGYFGKRNVSIESSTNGAQAMISNSLIHDGQYNGVVLSPPVGATNQLAMDHVRVTANGYYGVGAGNGTLQLREVTITNNAGGGLLTGGATLSVQDSMISGNPIGIEAQTSGTVRISNVTVTGNAVGLDYPSGSITSFGNNQLQGNSSGNGPAPSSLPLQ